jgi:hypothetical protein
MKSENNEKIYDACENIRLICYSKAIEFINKNENSNNANVLKIIDYTNQKSEISYLIKKNDWATLFVNKQWLSLLDMAYNIECLYNFDKKIKRLLKVILNFFSKEVECCVFSYVV